MNMTNVSFAIWHWVIRKNDNQLARNAFRRKELEKRQNDLISRLFDTNEKGGINATRLVVKALQLHIIDLEHLEPDEE